MSLALQKSDLILTSHGFCASFSAVRKCLTSLANNEIELTEDLSYIPTGIDLIGEGDNMIQWRTDNIDIMLRQSMIIKRPHKFHQV